MRPAKEIFFAILDLILQVTRGTGNVETGYRVAIGTGPISCHHNRSSCVVQMRKSGERGAIGPGKIMARTADRRRRFKDSK
jgi:hypothetical protein